MTDRAKQSDHPDAGQFDRALLGEIARLPRAIRPDNDPWPQISNRISPALSADGMAVRAKPGFNNRFGWALAASVLLVAFSGIFVMQNRNAAQPEHSPVARVDESSTETMDIRIPLPASPAEMEYQAAFREFVRLELSPSAVSDGARDAMLEDWALMRQLEQDLLLAIAQEPDNRLLQDRWMHLRASQLQLLHVIAEAGQLPGRTLI